MSELPAPAVFEFAKHPVSGINPVGDRILIQRDVAPSVVGDILLPEQARAVQHTGIVVRAGIDARYCVGDRVMFGQYAGTPVALSDPKNPLLLLTSDEVLAVLT